jgi:hypothetical protein
MSGSGVRGMSGSGVRGMSGSGVRGAVANEDSSAGPAAEFGAGYSVAVMGLLESAERTADAVQLTVNGVSLTASLDSDAADLSVGDYVVLAASEDGRVSVSYGVGAPYVPGVSAVVVKAPITGVAAAIGRFQLSGLTVDFSSQLVHDAGFAPDEGDVVIVRGAQALGHLLVLGTEAGALAVVDGD